MTDHQTSPGAPLVFVLFALGVGQVYHETRKQSSAGGIAERELTQAAAAWVWHAHDGHLGPSCVLLYPHWHLDAIFLAEVVGPRGCLASAISCCAALWMGMDLLV
mmetsp:Transcript_67881/g.176039  ORF Transcript_67881/g.176039 Transcript_67881/m.176039 type:complete len:105 (-) Transcript_67881:10-324(-)